MQPQPPASGRSSRLLVVSLALLVLLGLVALASRSGFGHSSNAQPSPVYVSYAFTAFLVVFVLAIPISAYVFVIQAREGPAQRRSFVSRVLVNLLTLLVIAGIVGFAIYLRHHHSHIFSRHSKLPKRHGGTSQASKHGEQAFEPTFQWPVLVAALAILVPLAVYVGYLWRRSKLRRRTERVEHTLGSDLAESISGALDDLESEPDARRAIIAAYARMEGVLGRHGLRRRPSDTPTEYLRRVLLGVTSRGDDVRALTGLFEEAKFSRHEVGPSMKSDAISALRAIRDDLHGAPA